FSRFERFPPPFAPTNLYSTNNGSPHHSQPNFPRSEKKEQARADRKEKAVHHQEDSEERRGSRASTVDRYCQSLGGHF
ncbi:hypothetical protein PFISCL1PPCAC_1298, partial [Pristionchus fissidentatus]